MFQILQHIEPLLKVHDFVIIPSLGGFVASAQSARYQEGTIYPPCKAIGFNPTLTYNDGLLAQSIAQANGYTMHRANALVEQETLQLKEQLHQWGYILIGNLGTLRSTAHGIDFEPNQQGLPTITSFGLHPVYFPRISSIKKGNTAIVKSLPAPTTTSVSPRKRSLHFAVACVAAILILLMTPINLHHEHHVSRAMFVPPTAFEEVVITPQIQQAMQSECTPYHAVIGSFHTQAKALKFLKDLPYSLRHSKIIYSDNRFRIIAASYSTEEQGNFGIEQIAKHYPVFKDAWLLHYNP